jgi:hypothetical protein
MRRAGVNRAQHAPLRIVPHLGQVTEHDIESSKSEHWGVFQVAEARSYNANGFRHFFPQPGSLAGDAFTFSGAGDVLARKPACDDINQVRVSFRKASFDKFSNVSPNWGGIQKAVLDSLFDELLTVRLIFNVPHAPKAQEVLHCKISTTGTRE